MTQPRGPLPEPVEPEPLAMTPATAAQWVRAIRAHRRVNQRELARLAGVPASTVSRVEAGATDPRVSTFTALVRAAGLELAARDHTGALVLRERAREGILDRAGRNQPAHLFLFRTPTRWSTRSSDWWGWGRVAFVDGDPKVPEWTYSRRSKGRLNPRPTVGGRELGYLWDDAT